MQALITPIPNPFSSFVKQMWEDVYNEFGLEQRWKYMLPHFTWQVCDGYETQGLVPVIEKICKETTPFFVETKGFGSFDEDRLVFFNGVKPNPELTNLHKALWNADLPYGASLREHYDPEMWHPHITIVSEGLTHQKILEISRFLDHWNTDWHFEVNRILLASQESEDGFVTTFAFRLGEGLVFSAMEELKKPADGIITIPDHLSLPGGSSSKALGCDEC